jgi:hypothetical protein
MCQPDKLGLEEIEGTTEVPTSYVISIRKQYYNNSVIFTLSRNDGIHEILTECEVGNSLIPALPAMEK